MAKRVPKDISDFLVSGKELYPFDFSNNTIFYDPQPEKDSEYTRLLEGQADLAEGIIEASSRNLNPFIVVGSMSNGALAYKLAEDNAGKIRQSVKEQYGEEYLTTQRLKHRVAADEMLNRVILPNRLQNYNLSKLAAKMMPDRPIMPVAEAESQFRVIKGSNAMSQGATWPDWGFERWWMRRVIRTSGMVLEGDHAYSRYKNGEGMTADQIQCGLLDHLRKDTTPGSEYHVVDATGRDVPLADRAWEAAKHIVDVVERGFHTDMAVATLAVDFQLDDWLRGKDDKNNPIDHEKLHPVLKNRTPEELERMDRLKEIMLPYLAKKCAEWTPYEGHKRLNSYFTRNVLPLQKTAVVTAEDVKEIKKELFSYIPRGGFVNPDYHTAQAAKDASALGRAFASATDRAPAGHSVDVECFKRPAKIFDRNHFNKLDLWEQEVLKSSAATATSVWLAQSAPCSVFYACEPKGGDAAKAYADRKGIDWLKEAQSADIAGTKNSFSRDVIRKNVRQDSLTQEILTNEPELQARRAKHLISTLDIHEMGAVIQKFRHGVAAKGPERLSARALLALQMEIFDRRAEVLVLRKGWQYHPNDVQMALRAVLHATGQIEPSYEGKKYRMEIFEHDANAGNDRLKKLDLHDIVKPLFEYVISVLDRSPAVPDKETILSAAQLLEITDKLIDPGRKNYELIRDPMKGKVTKTGNEIIKWHLVDADLTSFMYSDPQKAADLHATKQGAAELSLRDRLRSKLLSTGVLEFDREDLKDMDVEYTNAWSAVHGRAAEQELDKNTPRQTRYVNHKGPT